MVPSRKGWMIGYAMEFDNMWKITCGDESPYAGRMARFAKRNNITIRTHGGFDMKHEMLDDVASESDDDWSDEELTEDEGPWVCFYIF